MATKLTLRIDAELIAQAKSYGRTQGKSVYRLVADYFAGLAEQEAPREAARDTPATPLVDSLRGVLKETRLGREDYLRHLEQRHR
ncbi:DUF6364 family protein [uncultured Thiodictyon sp.]|jgi:hypothetical protein|uniref:DUF6364 family protein n=1 Tax=uncultured Thiodictyon sp. TaxID=1846217 RepID=UPI0025D86AEA|nr:DUF6364 family protein [uncultured Thiodictyon sp.]